jgi:RND family efflux transporter MFP subunit
MTAMRSHRKLWLGIGGILLLTLFAGAAWTRSRSGAIAAQVQPETAPSTSGRFESVARVKAIPVRREDLSLRKEATGYLEPWRSVEVSTEATGRVVRRLVEEGQWVGAGQLLVGLDDRERLLEIREAEAEWLKIRAQYAVNYESGMAWSQPAAGEVAAASGEPGGAERRFAEGLISKQELDKERRKETEHLLSGSHQREIRAASSGLAQAEQRLSRAHLALKRTGIIAPFAGRVADLAVEPGQQISPGEPLLTLLDDARLKVEVSVLETDIVRLREGRPATVRIPALGDMVLDGTVHTINPLVDPKTGTGRVTVTLPNPRGRLMPGLFAYVELETGRLPERLLAPAAAVLERQDRQLVFRIEKGKALWAYVKTGARSGDLVEILEGLAEGDLVAVSNHFALAHEAPVEVVE